MYRKGLTVKRIAALCGSVPQTVSRHIRVQRAQYPDMLTEHLSNRPAATRPPPKSWLEKADALAAFREANGRFPTSGDSGPAAKRLAQWLSLQRRAHVAGVLPVDRRQVLDAMPGWDRNQRAVQEAERWASRLEELRAFRVEAGRWPRFRNSVDEDERVLGVWLHGQRQAFGAGRLTVEQVGQLDAAAPDWRAWRVKHAAKLADRG